MPEIKFVWLMMQHFQNPLGSSYKLKWTDGGALRQEPSRLQIASNFAQGQLNSIRRTPVLSPAYKFANGKFSLFDYLQNNLYSYK